MTYRASAVVAPPVERPPPIFGFGLYVMGTGALIMGLLQVCLFGLFHHLTWTFLGVAIRWGMPVGQLMVALGLGITWRTSKGASRRLLSVAGALWATLFVLDFERAQVRAMLMEKLPRAWNATYVAMWAGWTLALALVAVVVFRGGRAFASRTWPTLLGVTLMTAHAFEQAWPMVVPLRESFFVASSAGATGLVILGALGLVAFAGGLYAAGRTILRGVTVEEYARSGAGAARRKDEEDRESEEGEDTPARAMERGLPLFVDASVALTGIATALAAAITFSGFLAIPARDLADTSVMGGVLVSAALLALALRRMRPAASRAFLLATLALLAQSACAALLAAAWMQPSPFAYDVLRDVHVVPLLLVAAAWWSAAGAVKATWKARPSAPSKPLAARLRGAAIALAACAAAVFLAGRTADPGGRGALQVVGVIAGVLAFASTLGAARETHRVEAGAPARA